MENTDHMDSHDSNSCNHCVNDQQQTQTDFYVILGVNREASQEQIKSKYNELLLLHHPDKGGDPKKFKDLQIAYKILSNPRNREIYTQSLSSTFIDITEKYRDKKTGKYKDIGYQVNDNDFTRGSVEEIDRKKCEFMKKFDENRDENEKKIFDDLQSQLKPSLTFEQLLMQRKNEDSETQIQMVEGLNVKNLNLDLFNQVFEANKKNQASNLQLLGNPKALGKCGLMPLNNQMGSGLFTDDPFLDDLNNQQFLTYQQPLNLSASQFDENLNVTRTKDNNPNNLSDLILQRLKQQERLRKKLLFLDKEKYIIDDEHNPKNNPLSYYNMLQFDGDVPELLIDVCKNKINKSLK